MTEPSRAVFLSYASEDSEAAARIADALKAAGIEVWFDKSELRGGDAWDRRIRAQVQRCQLFVPIISASTEARDEGYFRREWNFAAARMLDMAEDHAFLLPVVIDDTPEVMARVPDRFRERQWSRLVQGAVTEGFADLVRRALATRRANGAIATPPTSGGTDPVASTTDAFWVAVLPLRYTGSDGEAAALTEALTDEITTGFSRFSYLRVIARSSTARFAAAVADARSIGRELGARYILDGSLRVVGYRLRLTVQLTDASSGAHLWAETFERPFGSEAAFELLDELVPPIVSTIADVTGVLARSMSAAVRTLDPQRLTPYEAVLRSFGYFERLTPEDLAAARAALECALRDQPGYADAWAMLALLDYQDFAQGFKLRPNALDSALAAAQRAVAAGPMNHLAHWSLAQALAIRRDFKGFRHAAERSLALNPMDGNAAASIASVLYYQDPPRGLELAARSKRLNPHHPGWYWLVNAMDAFMGGDYQGAIDLAMKTNLPANQGVRVIVAAACGQLGDLEAGVRAVAALLELRPGFASTASADIGKWFPPKYLEPVIDGLRKAGLAVE